VSRPAPSAFLEISAHWWRRQRSLR